MSLPAAAGEVRVGVELANGSQHLLAPAYWENMVSPSAFALPGDVVRFRDPRAGELERTEAEQSADAAAGMTWLPEVLLSPVARVLYGQRLNSASWIVHGGERNWLVRMVSGISQLRLNSLVFGRDRSALEAVHVTMTLVGSYAPNQFPLGTYGYVVVDAMPDGTRALVATYLRNPQSVNDDPAWFAPCRIPLVELWELRLSQVEGEWSGEYECICTPAQVIGTASNPARPAWRQLSAAMAVRWEQTASGPAEWTGIGGEDGGSLSVGNTPSYLDQEPGGWSYRESGRLVGAYYDDAGNVAEIRVAITVEDTFGAALDSSMSSSPAVTRHNPYGHPGGHELITPGNYQLNASYSSSSSSITTIRLLDAGVETSRVVMSVQASMSASYQASLALVAGPANGAVEERSSSSSNSASRTETILLDGVEVFSSSVSSSAPGAESVAVGGSYAGRGIRTNWVTWQPVILAGTTEPELVGRAFEIVPMRYSSQMVALAVRDKRPGVSDRTTIGKVATRGGIAPGSVSRSGALNHLFGSHNPITGQNVRDAINPVCWV
ncbi:hypothetical protein [Ectopseudomonas toyotomiensis]|nr:hypothetical protein [Pseudomonas toyotomiensis]